jgi:hypothetical protein
MNNTQQIIEKCINSGLFSYEEEEYFTWDGCDYCADNLGNHVQDCKGYTSLEEAQECQDNYYEFKICPQCLYTLYYGE